MIEERRLDPDEWGAELNQPDGYQLVVSGPGTGKTEFLVRRVTATVASGSASRDQILVLTFSRRAAREIGNRIESSLGGSTVPIEATTFHSLALRIMETSRSGATPQPLTTPEQVGLVKELLKSDDPANWPITYRGILGTTGFAEEVSDFLMRCAERLMGPAELEAQAADRADWQGIPTFYRRYLDHLAAIDRIDYGALLVSAVEILRDDDSRAIVPDFRYVLVDEYQDTSPAQAEMADLLSARSGNLTVTGDPYQSIYSFRGAELRNIDDFQNRHEQVRRIVLNQSFRVPAEIMNSALRVVSEGDLPGGAGLVRPASHPGRVETYIFDQETAEAEWIASQIERAIHVDGSDPGDLAILVRSKREMLNEISRSLDRRQIPHNRPDRRLVDHPAVKLISDLVTLATSRNGGNNATDTETDSAARRLLLGPLVGMSLGQLRTITGVRNREGSWLRAMEKSDLANDLAPILAAQDWANVATASDGFWRLWTESNRFSRFVDIPERQQWRSAFASFAQVLDRQADRDPTVTLQRFFLLAEDEAFEATPLLSHRSRESSVVLTTLHQAKGLEFEEVFIANAVEGVFPDLRRSRRMLRPELLSPERTTNPSAVSQFQVQEEMRLAYTAMTRASRRVVWTATDAGIDQGEQRPSRFLIAASGRGSLADIGRPDSTEQTPITVGEAETRLRRDAADPSLSPAARLAAVSVLASSPVSGWDAARFAGLAEKGPDRPILDRAPSMSPSQADSYARCPRVYAIERRLRIGDPTSVYATSGTLIHAALEQAEKEIIGTGRIHNDVEVALGYLEQEWRSVDFGTEALNRAWLASAERKVSNLYAKWPSSSGAPVELEKKVTLDVDGVLWQGVIDRLEQTEDGYRIVDYKTGKSPIKVGDAKDSIQLGFYALAVDASNDRTAVVAAELWYPAADSVNLTTRTFDLANLSKVEEKMRELTAAISSEVWEPRVSSLCNRCSFKSSCPAWPEGKGAFVA
jgi:superfamily I DNA/RNA helicase/RecB family exonuclease